MEIEEQEEEEEEHSGDELENIDIATDINALPKFKRDSKRYLYRRPTNLHMEGDFYALTENAENFIEYILTGRPHLTRKPTTLKLEGDMEEKTETKDKYVPYETNCRPPLTKKNTNLHLEGLIEVSTENRERFLPLSLSPRPPLMKKLTNLHLEGILDLKPAYRDEFVQYKEFNRANPHQPVDNLNCSGKQTEMPERFVTHQIRPAIPFLREDANRLDVNQQRTRKIEKPHVNPTTQNSQVTPIGMKVKPVTAHFTKTIEPDFKNAYINFYRDAYGKFGVKKEDNEPERQRRKANVNFTPEADIPRKTGVLKNFSGNLTNEGKLSNMTEKREQYIQHPVTTKPQPLKRNTEVKLEGPFECQPEYRRAYIDYITREQMEQQSIKLETPGAKPSRIFKDEDLLADIQQVTLPKSKLPVPVMSHHQARQQRRNSLSPSTRINNKENVVDNLFGSKIDVRNRSRTVGPAISRNGRRRTSKSRKRYGSPVLVENLAYAPGTSPVQAILHVAARGNVEYGDTDDSAFVVIDKPCCCDQDSGIHRDVCKEQRWIPSWYARPMK